MTDKKCPFAIMARGHLRAEESLCLEDACAIWDGDQCAILAIARNGIASGVVYQIPVDAKPTKRAKISG